MAAVSEPVFISYASRDATVAKSIVEHLEGRGLKCWMAPRDVKPGAQYADAIVQVINEAKAGKRDEVIAPEGAPKPHQIF